MQKPTGSAVAARAVAAVAEGISYNELDCQAFVEYVVNECIDALSQGERGAHMAYAGSNAMARSCAAAGRLWTLAQAKEAGRLQPGAALFIWDGMGGEPEKYKADGLGNFSHVGFYVGKNALVDEDKNGNERNCDVVHSSATMERVAGSTLGNAWTHVGWFAEVEGGGGGAGAPGGGADAGELGGGDPGGGSGESGGDGGSGVPGGDSGSGGGAGSGSGAPGGDSGSGGGSGSGATVFVQVCTPNGGAVKMRAEPSARCPLYKLVPNGERMAMLDRVASGGATWCKVQRGSRKWYIMADYLREVRGEA